jgi:hypothetical protein
MSRSQRIGLLAAAAAIGICAVLGSLAGHPDLLAYTAPLYLLVVPLLAGRYVGEDALERLVRHRPARRRPLVSRALPKGARRVAVLLPRGGSLIAEALAVRPPPLSSTS